MEIGYEHEYSNHFKIDISGWVYIRTYMFWGRGGIPSMNMMNQPLPHTNYRYEICDRVSKFYIKTMLASYWENGHLPTCVQGLQFLFSILWWSKSNEHPKRDFALKSDMLVNFIKIVVIWHKTRVRYKRERKINLPI